MCCSLIVGSGVKIAIVRVVRKGSVIEDFLAKRISKGTTGHILNDLNKHRKRRQTLQDVSLTAKQVIYQASVIFIRDKHFNDRQQRKRETMICPIVTILRGTKCFTYYIAGSKGTIQGCGIFVTVSYFVHYVAALQSTAEKCTSEIHAHAAQDSFTKSLLPWAGLELCGFKRKCLPNSKIFGCFYSQTEYSNSTVLNQEYKTH